MASSKQTSNLSINVVKLAHLAMEPQLGISSSASTWPRGIILRKYILRELYEEDFKEMVAQLGVKYDLLPARSYGGKVRELIEFFGRRHRIDELFFYCRQKLSHVDWVGLKTKEILKKSLEEHLSQADFEGICDHFSIEKSQLGVIELEKAKRIRFWSRAKRRKQERTIYHIQLRRFVELLWEQGRLNELVVFCEQRYSDIDWLGKLAASTGSSNRVSNVAPSLVVQLASCLRRHFSKSEIAEIFSFIDENGRSVFAGPYQLTTFEIAVTQVAYSHYIEKLPEVIQRVKAARPHIAEIQALEYPPPTPEQIPSDLYIACPKQLTASQFASAWLNYWNVYSRQSTQIVPIPKNWGEVVDAEQPIAEKVAGSFSTEELAWPELHATFVKAFDIIDFYNAAAHFYAHIASLPHDENNQFDQVIQEVIAFLLRCKKPKTPEMLLNTVGGFVDFCCVLRPQFDWEQITGFQRRPLYYRSDYYFPALYQMLVAAFEESDGLIAFCRAFFPRAMDQISIDMVFREQAGEVARYFDRHEQTTALLARMQDEYPQVYNQFVDKLTKAEAK
ncbi:MAG: hypothetical protein AAF614_02900 [Chloroflexota bacterium]